MTNRTTRDLLAERRENIREARRETDDVAIAMLWAHVADIDHELASRRQRVRAPGIPAGHVMRDELARGDNPIRVYGTDRYGATPLRYVEDLEVIDEG